MSTLYQCDYCYKPLGSDVAYDGHARVCAVKQRRESKNANTNNTTVNFDNAQYQGDMFASKSGQMGNVGNVCVELSEEIEPVKHKQRGWFNWLPSFNRSTPQTDEDEKQRFEEIKNATKKETKSKKGEEETWCVFCGTTDHYRLTGWSCTVCDRNGVREIKFPKSEK